MKMDYGAAEFVTGIFINQFAQSQKAENTTIFCVI